MISNGSLFISPLSKNPSHFLKNWMKKSNWLKPTNQKDQLKKHNLKLSGMIPGYRILKRWQWKFKKQKNQPNYQITLILLEWRENHRWKKINYLFCSWLFIYIHFFSMCSKILVAVTSERAYPRVNVLIEFHFTIVNFELLFNFWNLTTFSKFWTFWIPK